ncbi:transcription factor grauzone-like [Topomyia yanbarensis]|uniref:transcription factor grauzone-like n=1 Tax=Topomyia yanbarensis TaxID=2498891 RepID=UPI00273C6B2D|nr:transcription factor grauzone-like [Topomyia yanbarensis]
MSSTELENCFTCLRRSDNFLCITERDDVSGENVEAIFAKHFWFTKDEYRNRTVCTSCWEKIDEFHKFYCEVEKVHPPGIVVDEIKTETIDCCGEEEMMIGSDNDLRSDREPRDRLANPELDEGSNRSHTQVFVEPICKLEVKQESEPKVVNYDNTKSGTDDDYSDNDEECAADDDQYIDQVASSSSSSEESAAKSDESDSDVPLARRLAARKRKRKQLVQKRRVRGRTKLRKEKSDNEKLNAFIRQHMDITCHKCTETGLDSDETFETFYRLRVHFKKVHDTYGYIFCCNRKWSTKTGLVEHLKNHEPMKSDHSRCLECNCIFKDKGSYANHMFLVHTPEDQKQFKCDRCSKAFAAEDLLNSHIKWHEEVEKKNHHCQVCGKYFLSARNLENHNLSHHNFGESSSTMQNTAGEDIDEQSFDQPVDESLVQSCGSKVKRNIDDIAQQDELIKRYVSLNCSKCDFIGETFNKLSYHAFKVHNMNTHAVICCDRRFGKRQRLYEHCLRHLNPDHFKCDICGKTYADSSGLQIHKWWIHTPVSERPFKCDICGAAFVKDYLLKQHTNWHVNKERKTHFCEQCNKAYSNSQQLRAHLQKKHGAVCDWVCDICAKGFNHRALLEEHRLTHSEEGLASLKIQCEKCHRWLINKKSYLRHKRRCYDTSGPVKCDICGKESINEAALMGHKNFHHSNRPLFTCAFCGKECKTQLRLKEHEATHTGVVLYQCPYCPRTSNSSSNMYTHKKSAHPDKWAEEVAARFYTR